MAGDTHVNGRLTLGENTADNGGLRLALAAYLNGPGAKVRDKIDGFTPEQRLFLGYAQVWCENARPEAERLKAQTNPHSSNKYRVNGPVSNMHYGLLPRANRGIFAINELPDLAGKIQVGLFNILQEGDVQIKGYPIRLKLDVMLVFTANPEDYTARGKIITPLKDRIGSEIRTHYPATRHNALAITKQEAWTDRPGAARVEIPSYVREVVEEVAFQARADRKIDKRSGVSQRLPITTLELVVSNAERRALVNGEGVAVPRVTDVYAALPSITGKFELEYEGELRGAEQVARDLIRSAVGTVFTGVFDGVDTRTVVEWFDLGGTLQLSDGTSADDVVTQTRGVQGLRELAERAGLPAGAPAPLVAAAIDFILEGLYAQKKISRSDERGYAAAEAAPRRSARREEQQIDEEIRIPGTKKKYYN